MMSKLHGLPLAIIAILMMTSCASSKSGSTSAATVDRATRQDQRQQLLAELNLRPEQKPEVEAIFKSSQEQMESIRNGSGDRRLKLQQLRALSEETDQKLRAVLDADQMKVYEAYREKQRARMREQMGDRRRGRGGF